MTIPRWMLIGGIAGAILAACSGDQSQEAQGTAVASENAAAGREAALRELPDACEVLTAERAAEALDAEHAVKSAQSRHGGPQSICIYQSPESNRSVGLAIMSFKRQVFDYRSMSTEAFLEGIASAGVARNDQFASHDPDVGAGMYEFSGDREYSVWINSGIRVSSSPASGEWATNTF